MAPGANWKGFLRLSLVTCPVALYPATTDSEKIHFNQLNKKTGHRIKYLKVDADTGKEVSSDEIIKGYKVDTDTYVEVSNNELESIALESALLMGLFYFSIVMIMGHVSFVRPEWLTRLGAAWKRAMGEMEMIYDGRCGFCVRSMVWFLAFDGLGQIKARNFRTHPSPIVSDALMEVVAAIMSKSGAVLRRPVESNGRWVLEGEQEVTQGATGRRLSRLTPPPTMGRSGTAETPWREAWRCLVPIVLCSQASAWRTIRERSSHWGRQPSRLRNRSADATISAGSPGRRGVSSTEKSFPDSCRMASITCKTE